MTTGAPLNDGPWLLQSFAGDQQQDAINVHGQDQDLLPPDDNLAVGPSDVIVAANSRLLGFTRSGQRDGFDVDINTFLSVASGYSATDPRIEYDTRSGRFFFSVMVYQPSGCGSYVALLVSPAAGGLTGTWTGIQIADATAGTTGDQPNLGFSNNVVAVGWNLFSCSNNAVGGPYGDQLTIVQKSDLLTNITTVHETTTFTSTTDFSIQPAMSLTSSATQYAVENGSGFNDPHAYVLAISGTPEAMNVTKQETDETITQTSTPPPAAQPGTSVTLDTGDDHFLNAVWANGTLWTGATTACTSNSGLSCLDLVSFTTSGTSVTGVHQVPFIGSGNTYLFYPAVTMNQAGRLYVAFNQSSSSQPISVKTAALQTATGSNSLTDFATVATSSTYYDPGLGQLARWGDYNGAAADPVQPNDVWVIAEDVEPTGCTGSTTGSSGCWSTHIGHVTAGGYVLDAYGGVTPFGGASAVNLTAYWPGRDLARAFAARSDHQSGYVLDAYGGVHPFGGAPAESVTAYWFGWDIARGIAVRPDGTSGYVLDGFGGVHPFGGAPAVATTAYWSGWDIARGIVLRPDGTSGYVLDGFGGVHPFGGAPSLSTTAYWSGLDIARGIVLRDASNGYVIDSYGGIHPIGGAPAATVTGYSSGNRDRGVSYSPALSGGVIVDESGAVHPWWINGQSALPPPPDPANWPGLARGVAQ